MANADFRVPMWIVSAVMFASSDFLFKAVEGATSLVASACLVTVGSRMGREEVDSICSWVAISGIVN